MAIREIPDALMGETYFRIRMRQGKKTGQKRKELRAGRGYH